MAGPKPISVFDWLAVTLVGAALVSLLWFGAVARNPRSWFNPLPPPDETHTPALPTPSAEFTPSLCSGQALTKEGLTASATPTPPAPTPSPTVETPFPAPTRAEEPTQAPNPSGMPFQVRGDGPAAAANIFNSAGCAWMGIGGQVFDLNGEPVSGLVIHLSGGGLSVFTLTGSKTAYGGAGYEVALADHPAATYGVYAVQLLTVSGAPLSDPVSFDTYDDCSRNLVMINFEQVR